MKKCFVVVFVCIAFNANAWINNGHYEEENVMAKALAIRAKELEKLTGCTLPESKMIEVSLEFYLGGKGSNTVRAQYDSEKKRISFVISVMYDINVQHLPTPLRLLDPIILAQDEEFGKLADHMLGYILADAMYRKTSKNGFLSDQQTLLCTHDELVGLSIISEGIAQYFENVKRPLNEERLSKLFPSSTEENGMYGFEYVKMMGGYWLVKDIIDFYGERGLTWIVTHKFVPDEENIRKSAIKYRQTALEELGKPNM